MSHAKRDEEIIKRKHNISRFFVEQRHISWVMLIAVCLWVSTAIGVCLSAKTLTRRSKAPSPSPSGLEQRRKGRAADYQEGRREDRSECPSGKDSLDLSHQFFSCLCRSGREHAGQSSRQGTRRHRAQTRHCHWLAGRCRPRQFHQGLWRYSLPSCSRSPARRSARRRSLCVPGQ